MVGCGEKRGIIIHISNKDGEKKKKKETTMTTKILCIEYNSGEDHSIECEYTYVLFTQRACSRC